MTAHTFDFWHTQQDRHEVPHAKNNVWLWKKKVPTLPFWSVRSLNWQLLKQIKFDDAAPSIAWPFSTSIEAVKTSIDAELSQWVEIHCHRSLYFLFDLISFRKYMGPNRASASYEVVLTWIQDSSTRHASIRGPSSSKWKLIYRRCPPKRIGVEGLSRERSSSAAIVREGIII